MYNNKRQKDTQIIVTEIFIEHPDWNAKQVYDRYCFLIGDINKAVTLNAVQKHVQKLKDKNKEITKFGLDNSWHMGLLDQYHFSPEAIRKIFELMIDGRDITIRRAVWISRFCTLSVSLDLLFFMAYRYAAGEYLSQLSGEPTFDTTTIDREFIGVILSKPEKAKSYVAFHKRDPEKLKSIRNELKQRKVKNERSHSTTKQKKGHLFNQNQPR